MLFIRFYYITFIFFNYLEIQNLCSKIKKNLYFVKRKKITCKNVGKIRSSKSILNSKEKRIFLLLIKKC